VIKIKGTFKPVISNPCIGFYQGKKNEISVQNNKADSHKMKIGFIQSATTNYKLLTKD